MKLGRTDASWKKHDIIRDVSRGQASVLNKRFGSRGIIIDMHSGDGAGVTQPQLDLFYGNNPSSATPEIARTMARLLGDVDIVLCEKNRKRRDELIESFPLAKVIKDHAIAIDEILPCHKWAVVLNDPNGWSGHGVEYMRAISRKVISDFIIVFNHGAMKRVLGMDETKDYGDNDFATKVRAGGRENAWMIEPDNWRNQIGRRCVGASSVITASQNFQYRVLVVTNFLTDAVMRHPLFKNGVLK